MNQRNTSTLVRGLRVFERLTTSARARGVLSSVLTLALFASFFLPLAPQARAQQQAATDGPAAKSALGGYRAVPGGRRGFLLFAGENGVDCRLATPAEVQKYLSQDAKSRPELRQINHLEDGPTAYGPAAASSATNLTIILRATAQLDANPTAKAAFIAAAQHWEQIVQTPITVIIDVDYGTTAFGEPFDANVLGVTGGQDLFFEENYPNIRASLLAGASSTQEQNLYNVLPVGAVPTDHPVDPTIDSMFIPSPTLRALGEIGPNANDAAESPFFGPVPQIGFNSTYNFDFNPNDGIGGSQLDFDAVATHEIGHVLGFTSASGLHEISFPPGQEPPPLLTMWDIFRFPSTTSVSLANFQSATRTLRSTTGNHKEFNGNATANQLSTGRPDGNGGDGEQSAHWKDNILNGGVHVGVMDPKIANGERDFLRDNDKRALDAMGYRVVVGSEPSLPAPPAPVHDNFANAKQLFGGSGNDAFGSSRAATSETGEPGLQFNIPPLGTRTLPPGRSVWYKWTASQSGTATLTTQGSNYDTLLGVYSGPSGATAFNQLTLVGSNDDAPAGTDPSNPLVSRVQFSATQGTTYYFYFDGFLGAGGTANLTYQLPGTAQQPAFFTLTNATPSISESGGSLVVSVIRNDTTLAQSVSYATSDGTAVAGSDYTATSGTLNFGVGQGNLSFSVPIINDQFGEQSETFNVTLSNPTNGASLGTPSSAVVTINDNDSSVQFTTSQITVTETNGPTGGPFKVDLTVERTGDTTASATVGYSTANGTASERGDFATALGTLRFAPGETSKTFTVFLVDDTYGDGNTNNKGDVAQEFFNVVLTNSVLVNIGPTPLVEIRINNNEATDGPNPVKEGTIDPEFFVRQHYVDFLNREPDAGGLAFWVGQTTGCGNADLLVCRINVSAAFFLSPEFQETGFFVLRAQRAAFGRRSDVEATRYDYYTFNRDARQVGEGFIDGQPGAGAVLEANKQAYATQIVTSGEFIARFPTSLSASQYVDALFTSAAVTPTAGERQSAIDAYNAAGGSTAGRVAGFRSVVDASTVRDAEFRGAFVLLEYFGYMRRNPDQSGYAFWLNKLNEFNGNYIHAEMVKAFIIDGEYKQRFGVD